LNNLRILNYLKAPLGVSQEQKDAWYRHWIGLGLRALEARLSTDRRIGKLVYGDEPTVVDLCLVPQVWNARRFNVPLENYPTIVRLADHAMSLGAFAAAEPSRQPDSESPRT
jgi:maleylacetoacetate isomerase